LIAIVLVLDCYCFGIQLLLLWYLIAIVVVFDSYYYGILDGFVIASEHLSNTIQ